MLSETIPPKHKLHCLIYGEGTEGISNRLMSRQDTGMSIDKYGGPKIVNQREIVYFKPEEHYLGTYELLMNSPISHAIGMSIAPDLREQEAEATLGFCEHVVNPGYTVLPGADGVINWIDRSISSATGFSAARQLNDLKFSDHWNAWVNLLGETIQDYPMFVLNYGREAPGIEFEHGRGSLTTPQSIDAIINVINSMGEGRLADRLEYLASEEILEEGDTPVSLPVCNGFFDFFTKLDNNAYLNLTCANGWLCAEWDFDDGKAVILWFMDHDTARVTVLDSDGNFVDINEGQQIRDRITIMRNLERAGYFSCRNMQSSDMNLRTETTLHATTHQGSGETTDDHPQLHL